jgi:hypothetical protein
LAVNPGLSPYFPWGSKIASLYEMYEFEYCEFYFTSTVSGFAANGQQGTIVLSASYDAAEPVPGTLRQVEDSDPHTVPCLPSTSVVALKLDAKAMAKGDAKYVRSGDIPGVDVKTYDVANVYVTTTGCANSSKVGELHVRYRARLSKPVLDVQDEGNVAHFRTITAATATSPLKTMAAGTAFPPTFENWTINPANGDLLIPQNAAGNYLLLLTVNSQGTTTPPGLAAISSNILGVKYFCTATVLDNVSSMNSAVTAQSGFYAYTFRVLDAATATLSIGAITLTGGTAGADLWISKIPSELLNAKKAADEGELLALKDALSSTTTRLARLESLLSGRTSPLYEESKESDGELEKSVHIDRAALEKLLLPSKAPRLERQ